MSYSFLFIISMIIIHSSFCANNFCYYRQKSGVDPIKTDSAYLNSYTNITEKKQACFSLSNSDVNSNKCCFKASDNTCVEDDGINTYECPEDTKITNNCGLARYYQPLTAKVCTEISLVDGYCCFVNTINYGTACVRQSEIDEDDKTAITDDIKNYVNKFKTGNLDTTVANVECNGYYLKYYEIFVLLLAVML